MDLKFRNLVTLIVIAGLMGGSGIAIVYDSFEHPQLLVSETTLPDGTITKTFANNSLAANQLFNIWLGAIIGFGGAIIAFLYKQPKASGED